MSSVESLATSRSRDTGRQEGQWAFGLKPHTAGNAADALYEWNATIDWVTAHSR